MKHPTLGPLVVSKDGDEYEANVPYAGQTLQVTVMLDDATVDEALALAAKVVATLEGLDKEAQSIASRDLREVYNEGWNEYDEVLSDGTTRTVSHPPLSDGEFRARLKLASLTITGSDCVELWYEDGGLFWGHSVFVSSMEGIDFSSARAEIFG